MADTAIRIYILFLCINIVLVLAGFSIDTPASNILGNSYSTGDVSDATGWSGFLKMINGLMNFIFGGGIVGLLVAAGMPYEVQLIVGAPLFVLGVLALAPLLTMGAGAVSNLVRWFI